ncbi:MAG: T9SS type A sorting domain-containing protein [Bacteroides sp.]|nr:T9SS type A sorting domain-containing protein [Bacteroides sp.]
MKKIAMLLCAVALVAGANAQVKQLKPVAGERMPAKVSTTSDESPLMNPSLLGSAKADEGKLDTIYSQPMYEYMSNPSVVGGYGCFGGLPYTYGSDGQPDGYDYDMIGHTESILWRIGTGGLNHMYGSGEIGYSFDFSPRGWYVENSGEPMYDQRVVGAITMITRAKSTIEKMNDKEMPLRFKFYTELNGDVTEQDAYEDYFHRNNNEATRKVYHPYDPTKGVFSETVNIPTMVTMKNGEVIDEFCGSGRFGARFPEPMRAGFHPCISVIFPTERNDEDTLWNATLLEFFYEGGSQAAVVSEQWGSVYVVYDFDYQTMLQYTSTGEYARERGDQFLPDSAAQPNERYAIVPLRAFTYSNGGCMDGEIWVEVVLAEAVDIERGAAYDKYVEVKVNPAVDYTVLASPDRIKKVEIYNLSGKLVKTQMCNDNVETIQLNGLGSGMYVARVTTDAGVANKKIMVR